MFTLDKLKIYYLYNYENVLIIVLFTFLATSKNRQKESAPKGALSNFSIA